MARKSEFYKKERKTHPSFLGGWDIIAFFRYNSDFFCECFSNSMEIFTKKCSGFTKKN